MLICFPDVESNDLLAVTADLYESLGNYSKVAELRDQEGAWAKAADAYSKVPDHKRSLECRVTLIWQLMPLGSPVKDEVIEQILAAEQALTPQLSAAVPQQINMVRHRLNLQLACSFGGTDATTATSCRKRQRLRQAAHRRPFHGAMGLCYNRLSCNDSSHRANVLGSPFAQGYYPLYQDHVSICITCHNHDVMQPTTPTCASIDAGF